MKVSLKQIKSNKQGKLSKPLRPGLRDNNKISLPYEIETKKETKDSKATRLEMFKWKKHNSPEDWFKYILQGGRSSW